MNQQNKKSGREWSFIPIITLFAIFLIALIIALTIALGDADLSGVGLNFWTIDI